MNDKILLFRHRLAVRWGDMDSYSHVNNTTYLEYIQEARVAWFASLGIAMDHVPEGPVVLQTLHTYLKPVVYPATLIIDLYAGPVGRSSLVDDVNLAIERFEVSHPTLAGTLRSVLQSLANMGI